MGLIDVTAAVWRSARRRQGLMLRAALAGLALVSAFASWGDGAEASTGASPIQLVAARHRIEFGQRIEFTVEAESAAAPIVEIRGMFTPRGPGRTTSYTYADFTPGRRVHARFEITTGGASYFPPGVEFDVHYRISDEAGNSMETAATRVEYLDPRFEWERATSGPVTIVYHDLRGPTVDGLLAAASERAPDIQRATGLDTPGPYRAILLNSSDEASRSFPLVSETASNQHTFAGFAYRQYRLFILAWPNSGAFVHELTHLMVGDVTRSRLGRPVPGWLNEGLAVLMEDAGGLGPASIARAARSDRLLPLSAMNTVPGRRADIGMFYAQSGAFVGYLVSRFGLESISRMLAELDAGRNTAEAAEHAFGVSLSDMDADFRAVAGAPVASRPETDAREDEAAPDSVSRGPEGDETSASSGRAVDEGVSAAGGDTDSVRQDVPAATPAAGAAGAGGAQSAAEAADGLLERPAELPRSQPSGGAVVALALIGAAALVAAGVRFSRIFERRRA